MACSRAEEQEARMGGNDWEALCRAKSRLHYALNCWSLSPREYERCREMLSAQSIQELESIREAWGELANNTCESR